MDRLSTVKPYLLSSQQIFQTYGAISYGVKHTWLFREHFLSLFLLSFLFYCFPLFLCTDHWWRLSYLSLLVFVTLHSNEYIFPFLLCFWLLFFSQQFVRPPQTTILPFCSSFFLGMILITASCTVLWTSTHSSSGTLSDLIPESICHFYCVIIRDLI